MAFRYIHENIFVVMGTWRGRHNWLLLAVFFHSKAACLLLCPIVYPNDVHNSGGSPNSWHGGTVCALPCGPTRVLSSSCGNVLIPCTLSKWRLSFDIQGFFQGWYIYWAHVNHVVSSIFFKVCNLLQDSELKPLLCMKPHTLKLEGQSNLKVTKL